jgi:nitrogen regulatory protein PII
MDDSAHGNSQQDAAQKIEIVANSLELDRILRALDRVGVKGYTVIRNVIGRGTRGTASDDIDMSMLSNVYIVVVCSVEQGEAIATAVKPILKKYGGVCFASDARWIVKP